MAGILTSWLIDQTPLWNQTLKMQIAIFTRILGIIDRPEKDSLEMNATFLYYITAAISD